MINCIADFRKKAGFRSQADLAVAIGWSPSRIGNYESGTRDPRIEDARAIVDAINKTGLVSVTLDDVFPKPDQAAA